MSVRAETTPPKLEGGPGKLHLCLLCAGFVLCTLVPILLVARSGFEGVFDFSIHSQEPPAHVLSGQQIDLLKRAAAGSELSQSQSTEILQILARQALASAKYPAGEER
jgi:hypothetical protein